MIFADKILNLRKKNGWSQEQLAEKLNVSRQSISKWEGAQSVPDLDKILLLSNIFGVSTDYLMKDELEEEDVVPEVELDRNVHKLSLAEAQEFLAQKAKTAKPIAFGVFLCIISPIALLILNAMREQSTFSITEHTAAGIGLSILLLFVTVAVTIFISCGFKTKPFEFLETEEIETEYGVTGMVKEQQKRYYPTYIRYNIVGTLFCILSLLPFFIGIAISKNDVQLIISLSLLLGFVGIGVYFLVVTGIRYASFQKLLQEGDYTKRKKQDSKETTLIASIYWPFIVAIYVGYSFSTNDWQHSWIIWVVSSILYGALVSLFRLLKKSDKKDK